MTLAKLEIHVETSPGQFGEVLEALFNPNQITVQKATTWRLKPIAESDTGNSQFLHGEPATLTMELFFDTYERGEDVRRHTGAIFALTTVQEHGELHRPPLCRLEWGEFSISDTFQCEWVLQSLNQRFTLFLPGGTPVRASLTCTFRQWRSDEYEAKLLKKESVDRAKTRVVRRGDTLSSIAADEYSDPALWRPIADANGIVNPRTLPVGRVLAIPALRPRGSARR